MYVNKHVHVNMYMQWCHCAECDCFLFQILHSSGHSLGSSWSIILEVISSATRLQKYVHVYYPNVYNRIYIHCTSCMYIIHVHVHTHACTFIFMYIHVYNIHVHVHVIYVFVTNCSASENLVRAGFQSLQLVITDFLPAIPPSCVPSCVEVGGQYGLQTMDINISLTSIGILVGAWSLFDRIVLLLLRLNILN